MRTLKSPVRRLDALAFSPDGAELAAGGVTLGGGAGLVVWLAGGWAAPRRYLDGGVIAALAYSADGNWLFAEVADHITGRAGPKTGVYALDRTRPDEDGEPLAGFRFALAGDRLVLANWRQYRQSRNSSLHQATGLTCLRLTPARRLAKKWTLPYADGWMPWAGAVLPDGRVVTLDWLNEVGGTSCVLTLRAAATGRPLATVTPPVKYPGSLVASPDGERVILNAGSELCVWRTTDLAAPPARHRFKKFATGLAFHPTDGYLLVASNDGAVRRLDPDSGAVAATYVWGPGKARSLAVAPDVLTAAFGTDRGTVVVFDLD